VIGAGLRLHALDGVGDDLGRLSGLGVRYLVVQPRLNPGYRASHVLLGGAVLLG